MYIKEPVICGVRQSRIYIKVSMSILGLALHAGPAKQENKATCRVIPLSLLFTDRKET